MLVPVPEGQGAGFPCGVLDEPLVHVPLEGEGGCQGRSCGVRLRCVRYGVCGARGERNARYGTGGVAAAVTHVPQLADSDDDVVVTKVVRASGRPRAPGAGGSAGCGSGALSDQLGARQPAASGRSGRTRGGGRRWSPLSSS